MKPLSIRPNALSRRTRRLERERLVSLINSMSDGVIALDRNLKIAIYNGAALDVLDRNSPMEGKHIGEVLRPLDKDNQPVDIIEYIRAIRTVTVNRDLRIKYQDDSIVNLYFSVTPVYAGYGQRSGGFVLVLRDITREKSLEEERDEFISVVSHELRTPIAITEGDLSNAQFIAEKTQDIEQVKKALKEAHDQILFLADMVNDLATLSRAERGKLNVEPEPIDAHELVTELAANYDAEAKAKGLEIKTQLSPQLESLQSSKLYVREILQNFITNALKYTEKGSLTISAKPAKNGVEFAVSDTGIGISKSDQEKVFNKFFRAEDYRTRKASGTGLGLYVTVKLARLIHAEISLHSRLNHGSTFVVFIPNFEPED